MRNAGIYILTDQKGRIYIGSSNDMDKRRKKHFSDLRKIKHCNKKLQDYFKKYGENGFSFSVIDLCSEDELLSREQYFIDTLKPWYNVNLIAAKPPSSLGRKHSKETLEKIRVWNIGRKHTPETLENMKKFRNSEAGKKIQSENGIKAKGKTSHTNSTETRLKISLANKGKIKTAEHIRKMVESRKDYVVSEETKLKMSIAGKGRKHTPESIDRMKIAGVLKWKNPEYRLKGVEHLNKLSEQKRKTI